MRRIGGYLLISTSMVLSSNASAYDLSMEVFEDEQMAMLKSAETSSDPTLLMQAGELLINESMMQENADHGLSYLKKVGETGNLEAMLYVADYYYSDEQYGKSLAWYHKAEPSKDPYTLYSLGVMYFDGEGTEVDYKKGNQYYRAAAEAGYSDAMYQLGFSYNDGLGVKQDLKKALYWLEKSAELGDASGMYNTGVAYLNGEGVAIDCATAIKWFTQAIETDEHARSYAKMGDIYYYPKYKKSCGLKKTDYKKSLPYFTEAANLGDSYSQYMVGYSYRNGHGTWSDFTKALAWFEVAEEYGDPDAAKEIEDVKRYMSTEQIAEANTLKDKLLEEIW